MDGWRGRFAEILGDFLGMFFCWCHFEMEEDQWVYEDDVLSLRDDLMIFDGCVESIEIWCCSAKISYNTSSLGFKWLNLSNSPSTVLWKVPLIKSIPKTQVLAQPKNVICLRKHPRTYLSNPNFAHLKTFRSIFFIMPRFSTSSFHLSQTHSQIACHGRFYSSAWVIDQRCAETWINFRNNPLLYSYGYKLPSKSICMDTNSQISIITYNICIHMGRK